MILSSQQAQVQGYFVKFSNGWAGSSDLAPTVERREVYGELRCPPVFFVATVGTSYLIATISVKLLLIT